MSSQPKLVTVLAPRLPEGVSAVLLEWLVEEGEALREGDPLAQILGGEGFHLVSAPCSGLLVEHWVDEGSPVAEGQQIGTMEASSERSESDPSSPGSH